MTLPWLLSSSHAVDFLKLLHHRPSCQSWILIGWEELPWLHELHSSTLLVFCKQVAGVQYLTDWGGLFFFVCFAVAETLFHGYNLSLYVYMTLYCSKELGKWQLINQLFKAAFLQVVLLWRNDQKSNDISDCPCLLWALFAPCFTGYMNFRSLKTYNMYTFIRRYWDP